MASRYPITSARIRPLERPVSPFLSDIDRDQLRADYLGPQYTPEQYAENDIALRGQKLADSLRGQYRTYNDLERAMNPQFRFTSASELPVADPGSAEGAAELRRLGYVQVGDGGDEGGAASYVSPDQMQAYREYQAKQRALQILGNEINAQRAAEKNAEYQQRQVDLRQANQLYGGLAEAGVSFAPGSLNQASVREDIWNSRGNIPGLVRRQSNDPEGYLRSPLSRSPFSLRYSTVTPRHSAPGVEYDPSTEPGPETETNDFAERFTDRRLGPAPTASLSSFRSRLRPRY